MALVKIGVRAAASNENIAEWATSGDMAELSVSTRSRHALEHRSSDDRQPVRSASFDGTDPPVYWGFAGDTQCTAHQMSETENHLSSVPGRCNGHTDRETGTSLEAQPSPERAGKEDCRIANRCSGPKNLDDVVTVCELTHLGRSFGAFHGRSRHLDGGRRRTVDAREERNGPRGHQILRRW